MKAIILAAGRGSRMGKYTEKIPKGLLEISGKTILEMQTECFRNAGITDISIVKGYKGDAIKISGVKYYLNADFDTTNMVVSLMKAASEFTDDVIVSYADILFDPLLLTQIIRATGDVVVLADSNWKKYWSMRYDTIDCDLESLIIDESNNIVEIGRPNVPEKDMAMRYIGVLKFSKHCAKNIVQIANDAGITYYDKPWKHSGKSYPKAYMTDLLQALIDEGIEVKAEKVVNGWIEFDSESDYEKAKSWVSSGEINALFGAFNLLVNYKEEKRQSMT